MDKTLEQEIIDLWKKKGLKVMKITVKKKSMTTHKGMSTTFHGGLSWEVFAVEDE